MLLSILANLVGIYSLINIPLPSDSIINLNNNTNLYIIFGVLCCILVIIIIVAFIIIKK